GCEAKLPEPARYRDFVAQTLHQNAVLNPRAFFADRLGKITEPTLPFDLQEVYGDGSDSLESRSRLPAGLAARIRRAARTLNLTPAALFHAAWALVVARCSGRDDVVFGTVLSGRLQGY